MAFYDTTWYCNAGDQSTTGYYAVAKRPQNTAVAAGVLRRQFTAPSINNERVFVCIVAGTTANTTDATWTLTRGAKTTDGAATWQECTGASAVNGDLTNTVNWTAAKAAGVPTLGAIIQRNNAASYQICSTAGTMGASEPSFSDTAGVTTSDGTSVWTSLGAVGSFTAGGAPFARLVAACAATWFASGNTIYIGDNHAETSNSTTTISPVSALMARILCHNHSGSYPPAAGDLTTGAVVQATGVTSLILSPQGSFYFYGISFRTTGTSSPINVANAAPTLAQVQNWLYFDRCSFQVGAISGLCLTLGTSPAWNIVIWNNTTVKFNNVGASINPIFCDFTWQNTAQILESGSSVPTTLLITSGTGRGNIIKFEAVDLSQLTGSLFANTGSAAFGTMLVQDCKLNASMTVTTPINTRMPVQLIRCDSGATNYKATCYAYEGTQTAETSITRVGGATDGTTAASNKIVTSANTQWLRPYTMLPLAIWNDTTGADVTVTVCGTINSASLPNNDDIFMEVEYLGSSSTPLGMVKTSTKSSLLAANAAVAADGSTWNGGGSGAGWSPFKLLVTLTSPQPQMKGYVYVRVMLAKASTTYYVDPLPVLT